jgi:hypothetical protein
MVAALAWWKKTQPQEEPEREEVTEEGVDEV